jgi:hypothetical protein
MRNSWSLVKVEKLEYSARIHLTYININQLIKTVLKTKAPKREKETTLAREAKKKKDMSTTLPALEQPFECVKKLKWTQPLKKLS